MWLIIAFIAAVFAFTVVYVLKLFADFARRADNEVEREQRNTQDWVTLLRRAPHQPTVGRPGHETYVFDDSMRLTVHEELHHATLSLSVDHLPIDWDALERALAEFLEVESVHRSGAWDETIEHGDVEMWHYDLVLTPRVPTDDARRLTGMRVDSELASRPH